MRKVMNKVLKLVERLESDVLKDIRKLKIKMPNNYVAWEKLSCLIAISMRTSERKYALVDLAAFMHSTLMADWWKLKCPIYCITEELFKSLDNTDALKEGILANWEPPFPVFILALPKGILRSPYRSINYLVVGTNNSMQEYTKLKFDEKFFLWSTVENDDKGNCWFGGTKVDENGNLAWDNESSLGKSKISEEDRKFLNRIRNLIVNVLLAFDSPNFETEEEIQPETKGFGATNQIKNKQWLKPRWLKESEFKSKSETKPITSTSHASPITHWRRGHWRVLQEGTHWKQTKRIWIKPQLIN